MNRGTIPDALLIGFQKSGTTFLRNYFTVHPQIAWGRNAAYFMAEEIPADASSYLDLHKVTKSGYKCYIDCYESLAIGYLHERGSSWSSSDLSPAPDDITLPPITEIPTRIQRILPNCKFLLVLRNQVDWLRSNYLHFLPALPAKRKSFTDFLGSLEGTRLLNAGLYKNVIEAYKGVFGEAQVHVILFEELIRKTSGTLMKLCEFLNVDHFDHAHETLNKNTGRSRLDASAVLLADRLNIDKELLRPLGNLRRLANKVAGTQFAKDPIGTNERDLIRAFYWANNHQLSEILQTDLQPYGYY